jgi:tetratricopeptide (TPR) repeat protein
VDTFLLQRLSNQMARGEVILFTGAGFSLSAKTAQDELLPGVWKLGEILWPIAFPGQPLDEDSKLSDIYEVARHAAGKRVGEALKEWLTVSSSNLPDCYRIWYSMPWYRAYTLNVDDLDEAAQVAFDLPRHLKSISAISESLPPGVDNLLSIHLNGRVADYPNVTFSPMQYGERTSKPDPWFHHLVSDMAGHPVLFVGTELDEPQLWQYIELRRSRERGMRELRPGSYLVTPKISAARAAMLKEFNIDLIKMSQEQFAFEVLQKLEKERQAGLSKLSASNTSPNPSHALQRVADLRLAKPPKSGTGEYLLGREPYWYDIVTGAAVAREFEVRLKALIENSGARTVLLTGTAGSGKSTTLMRLALSYHAEGKEVLVLNSQHNTIFRLTSRAVKDADADVLVIDDIDNYGYNSTNFINQLLSDSSKLRVIGALRSNRYERLEVGARIDRDSSVVFGIPPLEDSDIDLLLDALTKANRLGYLKGLPRPKQIDIFRDKAGRQLLVAMIEATSNQRFDEKIASECHDLVQERDLALIYGIVAVATHLRNFLTRDEILLAAGDSSNRTLNRIESLLNQQLFASFDGNHIQLRHRVIADKVVDYYKSEGILSDPLEGLFWMLATKAHPEVSKYSREAKFLRRLMSHELLINLTSDVETPRRAYASVESLVNWNYHYWLQRGSYEVEVGNIDLAENFLNQALSMAPDDYKVQTEWAYMSLKRASLNPSAIEAPTRAEEAFKHLEEAIESRGDTDSYPYHVLGSQGLGWVRRAVISKEEKRNTLSRLERIVGDGIKLHPLEKDLIQLQQDIKKEILMTVVSH